MVKWDQVLTIALGIFFGLGAFAALLALLFTFFDRQEKNRQERKEVTDLTARVRTLETENLRLRRQQQVLQEVDEDEAYMEQAIQEPEQSHEEYMIVRNARGETREVLVTVEAAPEEPRRTRYDRIEDNDPPV